MPWLVGIELDPWEMKNLMKSAAHARMRSSLQRELRRLVYEAVSLS